MIALSRQTIVHATAGRAVQGLEGPAPTALFTDSRSPEANGIFVALVGPRFDGHQFLSAAVDGGASCLVVSDASAVSRVTDPGVLVVMVPDTGAALMGIGAALRAASTATVVAVTGSVGKTTVKDMVAGALSAFGLTARTPGNFNNEIGLPLSLAAWTGEERFAVLELGMSAPGEIRALTRVAQPKVAIVTAATEAHLEFFSGVDAIADAKAELYEELGADGILVANADDARILARARASADGRRVITYGFDRGADVRVVSCQQGSGGTTAQLTCGETSVTIALRVLGRHNAANAAAAIACAHALDLDLGRAAEALSASFAPVAHRHVVVSGLAGLTVLDDAYNANPMSTRAALDTLAAVGKDASARGAVIGSMLELGDEAPALHDAVGRYAGASGVDWLAATGPYGVFTAAGAREAGVAEIHVAGDAMDLADPVRSFAGSGRWLLLKGSRGERLERLLAVVGAEAHG